jgi:hypothetical protein
MARVLSPRALLLGLLWAPAVAGVTFSIDGFNATYPAGKVVFGPEIGFPADWIKIPQPGKEYYLDYEVWFENDWEWVKGGKLPGLVGGSHTSGCDAIVPDGWSARFMWRAGGQGEVYLYNQNRKSGCGDDYNFSNPGLFVKNAWNRITEHVVINTPGVKDGLVEAWYNGRKAVTIPNVQLRGKVAQDVALIDAVSLQTFYGGHDLSWIPSHTTHARFSALYVRNDLPDFSQPFEAASGLHAAAPRGARILGAGGPGLRSLDGRALTKPRAAGRYILLPLP